MRYLFRILFALNSSFLISCCGLDVEDPTPPSPPIWGEKSFPEEWPEGGIDAHESGGIFVEWQPNPEENIDAYLVYHARYFAEVDSIGTFQLLTRQESNGTSGLNFLHLNVSIRIKNIYKLKAEDTAGNLSEYSATAEYSLLPAPSHVAMAPNGITDKLLADRKLNWNYWLGIEMEQYSITILDDENHLVLRTQIAPQNYVDGEESWSIPDSILFVENSLYRWRIEIGAQYVNGRETIGAESEWATFLFSSD